MSYGNVKNQFLGLLNRRDITPSLTQTFMQYGVQRIQRELRVPSMEKLVSYTTDGTAELLIPRDFLEVISINTNDQANRQKLIRCDLQTILDYSAIPGQPRFYHRQVDKFFIGPCPPAGLTVWLNYYADASALTNDGDRNWLTEISPALLVYAALSYACDYYLDDRKMMFEQSYQQIVDQLTNQAQQDELENASISPAYDSTPNYVGPFYGR